MNTTDEDYKIILDTVRHYPGIAVPDLMVTLQTLLRVRRSAIRGQIVRLEHSGKLRITGDTTGPWNQRKRFVYLVE